MTSVELPEEAEAGEPLEIAWTVTNASDVPIEGRWTDSVFLSSDATWELGDYPLGEVEFRGSLLPGEQYASTLVVDAPAVTPGDYRAIVRADILNQVYEDVADGNNASPSASAVRLTAPELTTGHPLETTLSTGQQRLYRIEVPADQTLRVTLAATDEVSSAELYLRAGEAPTPRTFDADSGGTLSAATAALIPSTEPGETYLLVRGAAMASGTTPVMLLAERLPLAITDIETDLGGDSGFVTATISGARFHEDAVVRLSRPGFAAFGPVRQTYVDATTMVVAFDFENAPRGLYDLEVINPDGESARMAYRFQIERTIEPEVTIGLGGPRYVFAGDAGTYSASIQNLGNVDAEYVSLTAGIPAMGINTNVYNLPFTRLASNLRGTPGEAVGTLPWAELDSATNVDGHLTARGFARDLPADGSGGFTFQVQTYPGLRELHDHAWDALKEQLYDAFPRYAERDLLAEGPEALDQIFPGLTLIWQTFGAIPDLLTIPLIPFQFHVVASATSMSRDEYVAHSLREADRLRNGILADADAPAAIASLAGDAEAWESLYLSYLHDSGLLRDEDAPPPARRDLRIESLMSQLAGGVLTGPGGDRIIASGDVREFFDQIRRWYGHDPERRAPLDADAPRFSGDSLSFFDLLENPNPIPKLPTYDAYDLGLARNTHFQAMRVYAPWVPFGRRGGGIPADYQVHGVDPGDDASLFPLNLGVSEIGQTPSGDAVSVSGPFTVETGGFVPADQPLPFTVNFQNDPSASRDANEVRLTVPLDPGFKARSFRLGDIRIGDVTIPVPAGRSLFQGDFDTTETLGFKLRVSAGVDLESRTATWLLQAIDPLTGGLRRGGDGGLLPPNNAADKARVRSVTASNWNPVPKPARS